MKHGITGIDHPVIAVRDMLLARQQYERLGFVVPPRGSHQEWGTGNWCLMFPGDYLELRGVVDASKETHHLDWFLRERQGLMGIALGTDDADATHRQLVESGLHPTPVRQLTRNVELPDAPLQPRFALCFLPAAETPGLESVVVCQHLTPSLLRRPEWLRHPNGAKGVISLTGVVADLSAAEAAHQILFGMQAVDRHEDTVRIQVSQAQLIVLMTPERYGSLYRGDPLSPTVRLPCLAAVTIEVDDSATTAEWFLEHKVSFSKSSSGKLRMAAEHACGVVLEFADTRVA